MQAYALADSRRNQSMSQDQETKTLEAIRHLLVSPDPKRSEIALKKGLLYSASSGHSYPLLDGIPWFFREPRASLLGWQEEMRIGLGRLKERVEFLAHSLSKLETSPKATRLRLENLCIGSETHHTALAKLFKPYLDKSIHQNLADHLLRDKIPSSQEILSYPKNVFRDWAWGEEENNGYLELVKALLGNETSLGNSVVFGSGSSRFAYDLSIEFNHSSVIATDFNPMLLNLGKKLSEGEKISLCEFPVTPKTEQDYAVQHKLEAPQKAPSSLSFLFSDAMNPPFKEKCLDSLFTPWLIDIVPQDFDLFSKRMNAILKEGRAWVNFGSLVFHHKDPKLRYGEKEVLEILENNGFSVEKVIHKELPYLKSPHESAYRMETLFSFKAVKKTHMDMPAYFEYLPSWILNPDEKIPEDPAWTQDAQAYGVFHGVLNQVNGKQSLNEIAAKVSANFGLDEKIAQQSLKQFLVRRFEAHLMTRF
jgi:hypothetical protein